MEKKNNTGVIIILFIIILGLVGYIVYDKVLSKNTDNKETTVVEEEADESTTDDENNRQVENENKYNSVIEEYTEAMKDDNFDNNETKYPNINTTMMHYYHAYNSVKFNYIYYDINKDNKDELMVGDGENSIFEVYTYNNKPVRLFKDETCLGDRCSLKLWDNGTMYFYGSGGANIHGLSFYQINNDGYSRKMVKDYKVETDENNNVTITDNITKNITDFKSDEELITSIKGNAKEVDLSKLDWKEIK